MVSPATSLGWLFTSVQSEFDCSTICDLRGPTVQIEPGLDLSLDSVQDAWRGTLPEAMK